MRALPGIGIMSLLAVFVAGVTVPSAAQDYPARPVRIVTGRPATMMDIVSRHLAQRLGEQWARPVVVDNRGMSTAFVSQAPPDGYTLLVADSGSLSIHPNLYRSLPYDPERDFAPIALLASSPVMLVAHPSVPAANLSEFITYAKRQPRGVDFANAGPWTNNHMTGELFKQLTGVNLVQVNYKGGGAATAAIIRGETKAGFSVPFVSLPHVKAGKLKAYAVTSSKRFAGALEVPTMAEAGAGDVVTTYWFGLLAPAHTPPALVERINREVVDLLQSSGMKSALLEKGAEPGGGRSEEFGAFIRSETARFKKVIEAAGLRAE
ncbi:MAG: tripartite tricarboxylate transporter substrate binding protein [Betaproteobacteria bacterium]|nr:tripartite tricarboxylate transporter substrate binding protein [Betaproteobacteria bacterium]